ncbi:MAG: GNAT family N-acetyltransferase [Anaeroplasmataceae bacterium]|jgi:Acetyltransferases, including N-acetylases of ribosomal proteins|nr:GNAT family N-acetyltransferase [Anaeroplasmataceae bacterium]
MKLVGKNIIIRDLKYNDLDAYFLYGQDPNVGPNAGWKPFTSKEVAGRVLTSQIFNKETYAITLKEKDVLIGTISLYNSSIRKYNKAKSLGFSLNSSYWGYGYMPQAVKLIVAYAFENTDCEVLELGHHIENYRSKRVAEKCGFTFDGTLCKYKKLYDGRLVTACFYSMTKEDYERMKKNESDIKDKI